ncbi:unnamed protein product [Rotaria socialis]|uniref:F-box domain-containing protein n=1 Tax=Rotaria socialis TaxID=392032 RepID=A0A821C358_9BILA|nr:unnamed protein product [Rotaria socialis]
MIRKLEIMPNEIFLNIFGYLSWDKLLISLWSLNKRINSLICLIFSKKNNGIIFNQTDLSYKTFSLIIFPLILNSSSLSSAIKYIYFDGINSNSYKLISQSLFHNSINNILYFPNLKSLKITRCLLSESLIKTLSLLIQYQLDQLTLSLDEHILEFIRQPEVLCRFPVHKRKLMVMFKKLINQLFSDDCRLTVLRLDIADDELYSNIHQCLILSSHPSTSSMSNKIQHSCLTLRSLYIRLEYTCFLEHLIERIPNIERLSVIFKESMNIEPRSKSDIEILMNSNGNWFEKVPKLNYFTLKTLIKNDFDLIYLKWILNNLNHTRKLKLHLQINKIYSFSDSVAKEYVVDANFIRQYCLPDIITNIKDFCFYIASRCLLLSYQIEKIINSFKIDEFFISRHLTNVTCFFNPFNSYQHLSSNIVNKLQFMNGLVFHPNIFTWPHIQDVSIDLHPSLFLLLERFDEIFPNVSNIQVYTEFHMSRLPVICLIYTEKEKNEKIWIFIETDIHMINSKIYRKYNEWIDCADNVPLHFKDKSLYK